MYKNEISRKSKKFTEENEIFFKSQGRNNDICYFRDILTQYKNRRSSFFKIKNQDLEVKEKKIINHINIPSQSKFKTYNLINGNTNIKVNIENRKEQKFSQTMENYYSGLTNLKNKESNNTIDKLSNEISKHNIISEDKISALFGIDQNKDKSKKEDLKLFKNLNVTIQPKEIFPNIISFYKKNGLCKKTLSTFKTKTTDELMNFFKNNFTTDGHLKLNNIYSKQNKNNNNTNISKKDILDKNIKKSLKEDIPQDYFHKTINNTTFYNFKRIEDYKVNVDAEEKISYEHVNILKIKIINDFLFKQGNDKFRAQNLDYRKIYVIQDGTIILNQNRIPGKYFKILKRKLYFGNEGYKLRQENLKKFINEINKEFSPVKKLNNIFLIDGTPILDFVELPDTEKCLLVSHLPCFRSIVLSNTPNIKFDKKLEEKLIKKQKLPNLSMFNKFRRKKVKIPSKNICIIPKCKIVSKKEYIEKYEKNIKNNTFVEENINVNDWQYKSDNEDTKIHVKRKLHSEIKTRNEMIIYFTEIWAENKEKHLRTLLKCDSEGNIKKQKKVNIVELVDNYNAERQERLMKKHIIIKPKENDSILRRNTNNLMIKFIENLQIINIKNSNEYDNDILEEYNEELKSKKNKFVTENIEKVQNLYFQIDHNVNKFYPDLVWFNIPKLLSSYPNLTRNELFELFVQYKSLIKICIALNRSMKILKKGVDFKTFHQGVLQMSTESEELAKKIFTTINVKNNNYLSWEEFLKGMITIKSENISDKIDMFFKIIDSDGNGLLSYQEVLELSYLSLKRNLQGKDKTSDEVINELARYFADLIFKLVDVNIDDEIPLPKIKEVYLQFK